MQAAVSCRKQFPGKGEGRLPLPALREQCILLLPRNRASGARTKGVLPVSRVLSFSALALLCQTLQLPPFSLPVPPEPDSLPAPLRTSSRREAPPIVMASTIAELKNLQVERGDTLLNTSGEWWAAR